MLTRSQFHQAEQRITLSWHDGNLAEAFAEIDKILREGTPEMKGECLLLKGMIEESIGEIEDAREHWITALAFAPKRSFLRYTLQHNIGESYRKADLKDDALVWYRKALKTCARGDEFSGNRTLTAFLSLTQGIIPPEDHGLVSSVVKKSWRVLELPGSPNLNDLPASITALANKFADLLNGSYEAES